MDRSGPHPSHSNGENSMKRWFLIFAILILVDNVAATTTPEYAQRVYDQGGVARTYLVRTPANGKRPVAIVVMLHGGGGNTYRLIGSRNQAAPYRRWNAIADREGLLLIAPQGRESADGKSGWNDCRNGADSAQRGDDVAFIADLARHAQQQYRVSSKHVFVVGSSNGGMMSLRMAVERPELVTATAAIIANMPAHSECKAPEQAEPVIFINGTQDQLMRFDGGVVAGNGLRHGETLSTADSVSIWARLAGAATPPRIERLPDTALDDDSHIVREVHALRDGKPMVVLDRVEGGGHLEPSRKERYPGFIRRILGRQNGDIEMADEVWTFFRAQTQ
jgi:polyhydroxybutyrate depolymerase